MSGKPDWRTTRALMQEWTTNCILTGNLEMGAIYQAAADAIQAAYVFALKRAAGEAGLFTVREGRSIHPDIPWDKMSETAKTVAHTTAQQISMELSNLAEDIESEEVEP
jgi:uncharacterized protein with HEPN domain